MVVNYSKIFTVTSRISNKPVTILVETLKPPDEETVVVIETLEGLYDSREEFEDALDYTVKGWEKGYTHDKSDIKLYSSLTLLIPGFRHLVESLNEALEEHL